MATNGTVIHMKYQDLCDFVSWRKISQDLDEFGYEEKLEIYRPLL